MQRRSGEKTSHIETIITKGIKFSLLQAGSRIGLCTVSKRRVLDVAILHLGNTHALIGKFCNYVLGRTSFWEWIYGDWSPYI